MDVRAAVVVRYVGATTFNSVRAFPDEGNAAVAKQTITQLIDDIDGSEAEETITFGIDGANYEIDLNAKHAAKLRDALATYIGHATPLRRTRATGSTTRSSSSSANAPARADREQMQAIREWGRANGWEVSDRGRIPAALLEAYNTK